MQQAVPFGAGQDGVPKATVGSPSAAASNTPTSKPFIRPAIRLPPVRVSLYHMIIGVAKAAHFPVPGEFTQSRGWVTLGENRPSAGTEG
jgi:hypothetical protein